MNDLVQPSHSHQSQDRSHWLAVVLLWLLVGFLIPFRGIDPDELEHLHATMCTAQGQIPYRDFFEHHAPALYFLGAPVFWVGGQELITLWLLRGVMWICSGLTLVNVARGMRSLNLAVSAPHAAIWLAVSTIFFVKAIEFRPDVPATLLVTLLIVDILSVCNSPSVRTSHKASNSHSIGWKLLLRIAFSAGGATLFTQKAIVPVGATTAVLLFAAMSQFRRLTDANSLLDGDTGRTSQSTRHRLLLLAGTCPLGVAVVWLASWCTYVCLGGGNAFIDSTVLQLLRWPVHSARWDHFRPTLLGDFPLWLFAFLGAISYFLIRLKNRPIVDVSPSSRVAIAVEPDSTNCHLGRGIVIGITVSCAVSLLVVKATFPQFYLLWFPCLTLVAAIGWNVWRETASPFMRRLIAIGLMLSSVAQLGFVFRGLTLGSAGPFPHLTALTPGLSGLAAVTGGVGFVWGLWMRFGWNDRNERLGYAMLILSGSYGIARCVDAVCWSNASQCRSISEVNAAISPKETVLDGFTGLAALRPHAYSMWWLNEFSLGLIEPEKLEQDLLDLLDNHPPAGVLYDDNLKRLPESVQKRLQQEYQPTNPSPLHLRVPKAD